MSFFSSRNSRNPGYSPLQAQNASGLSQGFVWAGRVSKRIQAGSRLWVFGLFLAWLWNPGMGFGGLRSPQQLTLAIDFQG
jgi:hypothetical protein